ncbi:SpoU rRNA methylase family protein [Kribbella sp. VKM Ac-2569]|uniref:TrmH family RNA methyltransferase n=1 Tax=Kribbella sp. VKM Ac-2569 TaxID=2512220 RepID=UPI00102ABE61|nr:TrmH family RNA methyltransferase [Kribbella sp. VKM Ac-2569]RZT17043.1 SpoU rRNA methylase family protein [Kribbella sp. VKM Ac-2569]
MSGIRVRSRKDLKHQRRRKSHSCWDHLLIAPLWPMHNVNLGTLLRTCDAVGACLAVPKLPWVPDALAKGNTLRTIAVLGHERTGIPPEAVDQLDVVVEIPMIGTGASLNVAVAGSLVLYRLAGLL